MALWLMGAVSMAVVATQDFYTIDRLLEAPPHPTFAADVQKLGHDAARDLLRYLSSELNRLFFQYWNLAQLAIAVFVTALITPRILSVGRSIDFVPRDPPPDGLRTFGLLHATYTVFDGVELILGILVTLWLTKL